MLVSKIYFYLDTLTVLCFKGTPKPKDIAKSSTGSTDTITTLASNVHNLPVSSLTIDSRVDLDDSDKDNEDADHLNNNNDVNNEECFIDLDDSDKDNGDADHFNNNNDGNNEECFIGLDDSDKDNCDSDKDNNDADHFNDCNNGNDNNHNNIDTDNTHIGIDNDNDNFINNIPNTSNRLVCQLPANKPLVLAKKVITKDKYPPYKVITGTTFAVDAFQYGEINGITDYFLTHFHAGQHNGLERTFNKPLYVSKITGI